MHFISLICISFCASLTLALPVPSAELEARGCLPSFGSVPECAPPIAGRTILTREPEPEPEGWCSIGSENCQPPVRLREAEPEPEGWCSIGSENCQPPVRPREAKPDAEAEGWCHIGSDNCQPPVRPRAPEPEPDPKCLSEVVGVNGC